MSLRWCDRSKYILRSHQFNDDAIAVNASIASFSYDDVIDRNPSIASFSYDDAIDAI